jgi:hypothetical protein
MGRFQVSGFRDSGVLGCFGGSSDLGKKNFNFHRGIKVHNISSVLGLTPFLGETGGFGRAIFRRRFKGQLFIVVAQSDNFDILTSAIVVKMFRAMP